jgi:NADH dehydrogenase (ubiquinone) 1 beta subcomplex subunit 11
MAGVGALVLNPVLRRSVTLVNTKYIRVISTSKKNRETVGLAEPTSKSETTESTAVSKKNWVSYGFDFKKEEDDRNAMHSAFFFSITLCIVFGDLKIIYVQICMMTE